MSRILVVDDDRPLLRALRIALSARGYEVAVAHTAATAVAAASHRAPDLAIIDLGLPDADGIAIIENLRGWSTIPIIVLSARHTEPSKINALASIPGQLIELTFWPEILGWHVAGPCWPG